MGDLVKRLREDQPVTQDMVSTMQCAMQDAAGDLIEELEAKLAEVDKAYVAAREETYRVSVTAEAEYARAEASEAALKTARRDALEEAAKVAEHRWRQWPNLAPHCAVECDVTACEDVANAIRALIEEETNP